jgi:hypothetical protein
MPYRASYENYSTKLYDRNTINDTWDDQRPDCTA